MASLSREFEPGAGERRRYRAGARRTEFVQLAERQPMRVVEMKNAAVGVKCRGDHAEAAEHAVTPKPFGEAIEMCHAVEQRQDRRLRADRRGKRLRRTRKVVGLGAEHDQVEGFAQLVGYYGRRGCDVHVAEGAADREAGPRELRGALLAHEKNDIAAGRQQPSAEISADGPGADHQYAHNISPLLLLIARRSAGHHRVVDDCLHHLAPLIERPGPHLHQPAIRPRP